MSYITAIETSLPPNRYSQESLIAFYQQATDDLGIRRKMSVIGRKAAISTRYSVISDFDKAPQDFSFFAPNRLLEPEPGINERMALYRQHAGPLSVAAVKKLPDFDNLKKRITHIITVTCTGLSAPGLDIELIRELGLSPSIHRQSVNFMGCNAAILALKNADAICRSTEDAHVLVVCTELSTIHFQKVFTDDNLLASSLFGDGCAAVMVCSQPPENVAPLSITEFNSALLHEGYNDMAWHISDRGFIINLSSYVSKLINGSIKQMLHSIKVRTEDIDYWAVHPGGKKILDDFSVAMGLSRQDMQESYSILNEYGNMSSPSVLFVLKEIMDSSADRRTGKKIFAAAFGPGLSIETMLLQYA